MQRKIIKISAFICVGMFLYFVIRANPRELLFIIGRLSLLGITCLMALRILFWMLRTLCWRIVLRKCSARRISFFTLLWAELAGHAVGHFTPSARLGGDVIRAMMVGPVPKNQSLASVVLDKSIEMMATVLMMSLGLFIALSRIRMAAMQRILFLSLTAAAVVLILLFFRRQKKGLFIWILETLKKLRIKSKYLENKRERLIETDMIIADFYSHHRRSFLRVFMLYIAMILLWAVEMHLTFYFIGMRITPMKSFLITTLGILANIVPVIPAGIGIYEMTYMSVFAILRIPQKSGIAVILVRRLLNLLLAVSGLFPMLRMKSRQAVKGEAAAVQISNPSAGNN
ncbi:MAG TPA: lysylphosphatidylglycerol synthase transmembrane domain-containing protein [Patescibacteria group bacterium]|nr:lysylphosphatidylglycerol synthase transmembrane domain-containing protein [Patescibacteria group bacterium]